MSSVVTKPRRLYRPPRRPRRELRLAGASAVSSADLLPLAGSCDFAAAISRARIVVDSRLAALAEAGELIAAVGAGDAGAYSCEVTGDGQPMKITVLDLSDLAAPTLLRSKPSP